MPWTVLIPLITQYGIPYVFEIWKIIRTSDVPTDAQWEALLALSRKSYDEYIDEAKGKIPPLKPA